MSLLPPLGRPSNAVALGFPDGSLSYAALYAASSELRSRLPREGPLALWATPSRATAVGLVAALQAGMTIVPLDPESADTELRHILKTSRPTAVLAAPGLTVAGLATISPAVGETATDPAATAGDRFILRIPSPSVTLAGGRFADVAPRKHPRHDAAVRASLERRAAGNVLQEELRKYPRGVTPTTVKGTRLMKMVLPGPAPALRNAA